MVKRSMAGVSKNSLTRRSLIKSGVIGAATVGLTKPLKAEDSKPLRGKMAVIGAGMGGISSTYFCDNEWQIDLFESKEKIGGHADTVAIEEEGQHIAIDLGAAFFHPDTHPLYWSLLHETGVLSDADQSFLLPAEGNLCIFDGNTKKSLFTSTKPTENLIYAVDFLIFCGKAREAVEGKIGWDVTLGDWVDEMAVVNDFKYKVLLPWLASFTCLDAEMVRKQSVRAHLGAVAKTFPENIFKKPMTYNAYLGLGAFLEILLSKCKNTTVYLNSPVAMVEEVDGQWFVTANEERKGPYDKVVVNAPPHISHKFLASIPWASEIVDQFAKREYYETRIVAHRDPVYLHPNPSYACLQTSELTENHGETSVHLGLLHPKLPSGKQLSAFKSWVVKRSVEPSQPLFERKFTHPIVSPETLQLTVKLQDWQGEKGLHFAGHFTVLGDSQDTALFSGMEVARALAPTSKNLVSFDVRLAKDGKREISYKVPVES